MPRGSRVATLQSLIYELNAHSLELTLPSAEFMREWQSKLESTLDARKFSNGDLAIAMKICADLSAVHGIEEAEPAARKIYDAVIEEKPQRLGAPKTRQIVQSCLWFDWEPPYEMPEEPSRQGNSEIVMQNIFANAGFPPDAKAVTIERMKHTLDTSFLQRSPVLLVEQDGPGHFIIVGNNPAPHSYNRSTLFQSALITKLASTAALLRMPFTMQNIVMSASPAQQNDFAETVMREMEAKEPGAYDTRPGKNQKPVIAELTPYFT